MTLRYMAAFRIWVPLKDHTKDSQRIEDLIGLLARISTKQGNAMQRTRKKGVGLEVGVGNNNGDTACRAPIGVHQSVSGIVTSVTLEVLVELEGQAPSGFIDFISDHGPSLDQLLVSRPSRLEASKLFRRERHGAGSGVPLISIRSDAQASCSARWISCGISRISATLPSPRMVAPESPCTSRYMRPRDLMTV